jgi:putative membrane protein
MMNTLCAGVVALGLAAAPILAAPQTTTAEKAAKMTAGGKVPDETFMIKAARGGMAEVELGKLAVDKAASDEVKKFGRRMVDDHSKAGDELKTLAQNKHITLPTTVGPEDQALHDRLAKLSGAAFDRAYMQAMVTDHRQDVNEFRVEAKSGKDGDVKGWAAKTLPTLEEHLKLAQKVKP